MIKIEQVGIKYIKDYYSLFNINLNIENNTLLLGDKTSGNNFLLRLIAKIDKHYEGEIFVDDVNLKQIKDKDLNLAYIPKTPYLFENKSVLENLIYPLKIRKIDKKTAILRAKTAIKPYFLKIFDTINDNSIKNNLIKNKKITQNEVDINFENFLNLKVKKLDMSTKKIITLLRAKIREPKYVLIENFFENLAENYFEIASTILNCISNNSIVIATEDENVNLKNYKDYKKVYFNAGSIVQNNNEN